MPRSCEQWVSKCTQQPQSTVQLASTACIQGDQSLPLTQLLFLAGSEGLARALLRAPPAAPGLSGLQDQLIKGYCNKILASKEATPAHVQQAYEPLLAQVSSEQFVTSLLPVLLRMLKRSPEVTLPSLASICSSSRLDLSDHATDLLAVLLPNLRSSKDNLRREVNHGLISFCNCHALTSSTHELLVEPC